MKRAFQRFESHIKDELNVKDIIYIDDLSRYDSERYAFTDLGSSSTGIDTHITPELGAEGMAREIVRRLQTMRRSAGFDIADYIITYYEADDYIGQVMADFADYIKQETLSRQLVEGIPKEDDFTESYRLSGHEILLGVKKLG